MPSRTIHLPVKSGGKRRPLTCHSTRNCLIFSARGVHCACTKCDLPYTVGFTEHRFLAQVTTDKQILLVPFVTPNLNPRQPATRLCSEQTTSQKDTTLARIAWPSTRGIDEIGSALQANRAPHWRLFPQRGTTVSGAVACSVLVALDHPMFR